jgi:glycosyltransferase involved in cell wall biosynthesis
MSILYITRKFPPSIGGMQTQAYEFYNALKEREQVHLISWGRSQKYLPIFLLKVLFQSLYYIFKYKIDVVQIGDLALSPLGFFLKKVTGKKVFAMAHGKDTSFENRMYRSLVFNSAGKMDGIICVSGFLKQELIKIGIREDMLFDIPNGINTKLYTGVPNKESALGQVKSLFNIDLGGRKVLLSVSRLVSKKGIARFVHDILPMIVENSPESLLLIVGEGSGVESHKEKDGIIHSIDKYSLQDKVCFLGDISDKVFLRSIYAAADIFVMPNRRVKGDFEGFGIVALEASMNELPVVAFSVDGIPDAVKDGENGILLKEGDNKGFANAIEDLLRNDDKRAVLGKKAKEFVTKCYDWTVIISRYLCIIKNESSK